MKKIAFIIPGWSESKNNNPAYFKIAGYFNRKGIQPVIVDIDWKHKCMSDYVTQFKKIYFENKRDVETYFLGFSFGAMIAFISSIELKPRLQILCSLSPYFKEDLPNIREWWKKYIGQKRLEDFYKISFNALASKNSSETILVAGEKEVRELKYRINDANKRIKNNQLVMIPKAKHRIQQEEYLMEIKRIINNL